MNERCSCQLVSSINGMVEANPSLSQEWVGLILLPIVGRPVAWRFLIEVQADMIGASPTGRKCCCTLGLHYPRSLIA
jgi:hypothetical protein